MHKHRDSITSKQKQTREQAERIQAKTSSLLKPLCSPPTPLHPPWQKKMSFVEKRWLIKMLEVSLQNQVTTCQFTVDKDFLLS